MFSGVLLKFLECSREIGNIQFYTEIINKNKQKKICITTNGLMARAWPMYHKVMGSNLVISWHLVETISPLLEYFSAFLTDFEATFEEMDQWHVAFSKICSLQWRLQILPTCLRCGVGRSSPKWSILLGIERRCKKFITKFSRTNLTERSDNIGDMLW